MPVPVPMSATAADLPQTQAPPRRASVWAIHPRSSNIAVRITLTYAVVATTWITLSDRLLTYFAPDVATISYLGTIKGIAFVMVTAVLAYAVLNRQFQRLYAEMAERQRAADALASSEAQLSNALKITHAGHWEYDVLADRFTFNDHFYAVCRTTAAREGGYTMSARQYAERFVPSEIREKVESEIRKAIETCDPNYTAEMQSPIVFGDGKSGMIAVRIFVVKDRSGRTVKTYGVNQDITDRMEAAAALREFQSSVRILSCAVEQSPVSILITDPVGAIEYANRKFAQTTGYAAEEVRGRNLRQLRDASPPNVETAMWDTLAAGRQWQGEYQSTRKNGERFWEFASISPVTDASGRVTHLVMVKEDVTERKNLEAQLLHVQKMEAFGQLAGGVAHDFNNILAVMLMQLGLAQADPNVSGGMRSMLGDLEKLASRAAGLTRQLLIFSRRQELSIESLDLNRVVEAIWKMLNRLIGENIAFELRKAPTPLWVQADGGMMEQVVMNLCVNARDAMPHGGHLTVALSDDRRSPQRSNDNSSADRVACLTVTDTGVGMDEATQRRIFEPFFTTKPIGQGTGLGLATVYGIVKQHHGWIEVESTPGHGSAFRVYLPLGDTKGETNSASPTAAARRGNETILLVEDEELVRAAFALCLRQKGYRVIEACDASEALREWESNPEGIALILSDMVMPGSLTGAQLAQQLMAQRAQLKVVLMSGYNAEHANGEPRFPRKIAQLRKPCGPAELLDTVRHALDAPNEPAS